MFKTILVTRPALNAQSTAADFKARGYHVLSCPLLEIKPVAYTMPDINAYDCVIITSQNACAYLNFEEIPMETLFICVGDQAQKHLRVMGYQNISSGFRSADEIVLESGKKYIHFRGHDVHHVFNPAYCDPCVVYRAIMRDEFPNEILKAFYDNQIDVIALYSIRTALSLKSLIDCHALSKYLNKIDVLCLSQNVLNSVCSLPWHNTYTSRTPDHDAMCNILEKI